MLLNIFVFNFNSFLSDISISVGISASVLVRNVLIDFYNFFIINDDDYDIGNYCFIIFGYALLLSDFPEF